MGSDDVSVDDLKWAIEQEYLGKNNQLSKEAVEKFLHHFYWNGNTESWNKKGIKYYNNIINYLANEKIKVLDEFYRLCDDVKIRLTLKPPKGRIVNLTDLVIRNKVGEYELNYEATMEGKYLFRIRVDKEGRLLGKDTTLCKVVIPNFEFEGATSNRALLEEIAMVSGGEYFSINEVKEQMSFPFYKNNILDICSPVSTKPFSRHRPAQ